MSVNLSLLPADEKNKVELDKQASFLVWKLREAKSGPEEIVQQANQLVDEAERTWFMQSVEKYKRMMGIA
ncbi:DUF3283 family protein [Vibrio scophthalmi]|uniref:Pyridoxamine 5-phosphate oxidase n=3 Tax=Vibrio TaxID=662 RepID=A0A0C2NP91_9VIBR|nr:MULTISPECIES: DUF3283 family protein [Vibrio]ANS86893.1 hypothetical protein VSVS12_03184 [Vibrio scophthalmi]EGU34448.1 hypothetical protein VIBRN418_06656 [Vibrio sp. N418]EGU46091.1 hypothetical protein VII00023_09491 [Vibrio ichthyoenteri ATCC 700023]KII76408.1 pyridoxamine 5-phosphate oxidase [Vibrio renipiscarius]KII78070.1 pyridoxamine 5-phosphate oxidase [Vibrio renipiscarius]